MSTTHRPATHTDPPTLVELLEGAIRAIRDERLDTSVSGRNADQFLAILEERLHVARELASISGHTNVA